MNASFNNNSICGRDYDFIVIVSGLPRSGTSMMMKVLESGGMELVTDYIREADQDNPKGYYEFERVKRIKEDTSWLGECNGKVVKMVSELLYYLPCDKFYKVIFMERNLREVYSSQLAMLKRLGREGANIDKKNLIALFEKRIAKSKDWLSRQSNISVLCISYNDMIAAPKENIEEICHFLENKLSGSKMCAVVDSSLYRQRENE